MSLRDHVEKLILCLENTAAEMDRLEQQMREERQHFVSLRGEQLLQAVETLRTLADSARARDQERDQLGALVRDTLQIEGTVTISRLSPRLPPDLAKRLRTVGSHAKQQAERLRVEAAVGQRLLEFARQTQEALLRRMLKLEQQQAEGYDRNARKTSTATSGGRLVKGVL